MRLLFLGFQDHRQPGAGGGAIRNHEINRRLAAAGHEILVVTAAYPGSAPRCEDGVEYRQIGISRGYKTRILSYQAASFPMARRYIRRYRPDIVAEEFSPPWSSLGVGHWTTLPTVGLAHGYFAAEKARQYHLPAAALKAIERWGTRSHRHLITNSVDVRSELAAAAPEAQVFVCGTGLDQEMIAGLLGGEKETLARTSPGRIVFLGRLEVDQKGIDHLVDALDILDGSGTTDWELVMAGDGPDSAEVQRIVRGRSWSRKVTFAGRVAGPAKWELLASACVVAMPSRYETYGTVALEALAAGSPIVHFDIPNLRHTGVPGSVISVPCWDVHAFAEGLRRALVDDAWRKSAACRGVAYARLQTWDSAAEEHELIYEGAIAGTPIEVAGDFHPVRR